MLKCGSAMKLHANVIPEVTGRIQRRPIKSEITKTELMKYELTDNLPTTIEISRVDVLIRNYYYTEIVSIKLTEITDILHFLGPRIGLILTGRTKTNEFINKNLMMLTNSTSISSQFEAFSKDDETIINNMQTHFEEFWKLETIGTKELCNETEDDKFLKDFNQTVEHKEGRYRVQWPWKENNPKLPDNYNLHMAD